MHGRRKPRQPRPALPPRGLRPKFSRSQLSSLSLSHAVDVADIAAGRATVAIMWQWAGAALMWSRIAQQLGAGQAEMTAQLDTVDAVVQRYLRTGRIGFSGPELQTAQLANGWMDDLAELVDLHTADAACAWSTELLNRIAAKGMSVRQALPQILTATQAP